MNTQSSQSSLLQASGPTPQSSGGKRDCWQQLCSPSIKNHRLWAQQPASPRSPSLLRAPVQPPCSPAPHLILAQVLAGLWCKAEVGFIYKFPLIVNHWRNCLQTGDKSLGLPGQEETLFTFDFPFGMGLPVPGRARLCQPLLFSEAEVLSACLPCCVNRTQGWRPSPTLEMSLPSAARLLPSRIRRLFRVQMRALEQEQGKAGVLPSAVSISLDGGSIDRWKSGGLLGSHQSPV